MYIFRKINQLNYLLFHFTGATETFGAFSGYNLNMPAHAGEIQAFSLGTDIKCFDESGTYNR